MIRFFIIFTSFFHIGQVAFSQENSLCPGEASVGQVVQLAAVSCDAAVASHDPLEGEVEASGTATGLLYSGLRCFQGMGDGIVGTAKGLWDLTTWIAKNASPLGQMMSLVEKVQNGEPLLPTENSTINLDKFTLEQLSTFVKMAKTRLRQEYAEYNCLPSSLRSQMLCKFVIDGFLTVAVPGKTIEGTAMAARFEESIAKVMGRMKGAVPEVNAAAMGARAINFGAEISAKVGAKVSKDLKSILSRNPAFASTKRMTGAEFNKLYDDLLDFAKKHKIKIENTMETKGIYPNGLNGLKFARFKKMDNTSALASAGDRHELAHLFHTLQMRATILESMAAKYPNGIPKEILESAEKYLAKMEGGPNYLELEKAVTTIASPVGSIGSRANSADLYSTRVAQLIDGTETSLTMGKVVLKSGRTLEDVYGYIVSRAPIILGQSGKEMITTRLPAIMFGSVYWYNPTVGSYGINPRDWGIPKNDMKFRDFIDALGAKMGVETTDAVASNVDCCRTKDE